MLTTPLERTTKPRKLLIVAIIAILLLETINQGLQKEYSLFHLISTSSSITALACIFLRREKIGFLIIITTICFEIYTDIDTGFAYISWLIIICLLTYRKHYISVISVATVIVVGSYISNVISGYSLELFIINSLGGLFIFLILALFGKYLRNNSENTLLNYLFELQFETVMFSGLLGPLFNNVREHTAVIKQTSCSNIVAEEASAIDNCLNAYEPALALCIKQTPEPEELLTEIIKELKNLGYKIQLNNTITSAITVAADQYLWCAIICQQISHFIKTAKDTKLLINLTEDKYSRSFSLIYKKIDKSSIEVTPADELLLSYFEHFQITTKREMTNSLFQVRFNIPKTLG